MTTTAAALTDTRMRESRVDLRTHPVWVHRFAVAALAWTFVLISIGGVVTSLDAGMAVPDWPTTFGHSMFGYPLAAMVQDMQVFYEHTHRLAGAVVGLLAVAVTVLSATSRRASSLLRWGAFLTLLLVSIQGIIGGMRVRLDERAVAVIHAVGAQLVLCSFVALAFFSSKTWALRKRTHDIEWQKLQRMSAFSVGLLFVHFFAGAGLRHQQIGVQAHLWLAIAVTLLIAAVCVSVFGGFRSTPALVKHAKRLLTLLGLQLGLGAATWWFKHGPSANLDLVELHATLATAHLFVGAGMMATVFAIALESRWKHSTEEHA